MSHKALTFSAPKAPFELTTRPTPKPGPGQVLVKVVAAALNPVDYVIQQLGLWVDHYGYPALAGNDIAGEVVELGQGVEGLKKGDRVVHQADFRPDRLAFQEYVIADAVHVSKIPDNMSSEGAATIPLGFATAAVTLYQEYRERGGLALTAPWEEGGYKKYAGQAALVIGGSSSVGQFAIQLLKASGFSPIITTASKSNEEYCKSAGATHVIDYKEVPYPELPAAVKKITAEPIPVIYNAICTPDSQHAAWEILAPNGSVAVVLPPVVGKAGEVSEDGKKVAWAWGSAGTPRNYEFGKKMYSGVTKLLASGDLKPNNYEVLPGGLAGVPGGLSRLVGGVSAVKLVVRIADTADEVKEMSTVEVPEEVGKHLAFLRKVYPVGTMPTDV